MAQVGQTTASGGRALVIYTSLAAMRRVTVGTGFTLNHIGVFASEQTAANQNSLRAAIYDTSGNLMAVSSIATTPITSTTTPELVQCMFAGESLPAGDYDLAVSAGPGTTGAVVVNGQNGTGGSPKSMFDDEVYPTFPDPNTGLVETTATRAWDIYLDYTEASSGVTGTLAATESGADTFAATGNVGNNGLRLELRDTDTGALAANLTGVIVSVRANSNAGALLLNTTSETTNASGVLEIASAALGNVGDYVYVTVEKSDHSLVAAYRLQVIDLNA